MGILRPRLRVFWNMNWTGGIIKQIQNVHVDTVRAHVTLQMENSVKGEEK
jgi:hypothetical protein